MASSIKDQPKPEASSFEVLRAYQQKKSKFSPSESLLHISALFEIFGRRYAESIRAQLRSEAQGLFDHVRRVFFEIQKRLEKGETSYIPLDCPETTRLMGGCFSENRNRYEIFRDLKRRSYAIWSFPQKILQDFSNPELETLKEIESVRKKAFEDLVRCLRREEREEEKGVVSCSSPFSQQVGRELSKLYFSGGALVYNQQIITFYELVGTWKGFDSSNREMGDQLWDKLEATSWMGDDPKPVAPFVKYREAGYSFEKFLIAISIDGVEAHLGFRFSPLVRAALEEKFKNEQIRSDFCYFTADLPRFYTFNAAQFERASGVLIRSFQLFYFIKNNCGAREADPLLTSLIFMSPRWDETSLAGFSNRRWIQDPPLSGERVEAFHTAWDGLRAVLKAIPSSKEKEEDLFKNPECWDLLFFLWENPQRNAFIELICGVSKLPNFSMNLKSILHFCRENEGVLKIEIARFFVEIYGDTIKALEKKGKRVLKTEAIFFDPPLRIAPNLCNLLGRSPENTEEFLRLMKGYSFTEEERSEAKYCAQLKQFILSPSPLIFDLFEGAKAIKIEITEHLFWDALARSKELLKPEQFAPEVATLNALKLAQEHTTNIQKFYQFPNEQIFAIYIEVFRLIMGNKEGHIWRISQLIHELVSFCPALRRDDIYFLFRYHPEVLPGEVNDLKRMRDDWAKNEEQLRKFIVDRPVYSRILEEVQKLAALLSSVCDDEQIETRFRISCINSLLSAFVPPVQPLTDYFRITNLTAEGIRWGDPTWRTHLGQLKFILKQASIGIYINWSIIRDQPLLFLSFFNIQKREAFSSFLPIRVSAAEVSTEEKREPFYGLLKTLSQYLLREETDADMEEDAPETPESWIPCFTGLKEDLREYEPLVEKGVLKREEIAEMWDFFKRVKLSYRNIFLSSVANRRLPDFVSYHPKAIAALGHIFPFHPRGSLLPEPIFRLRSDPGYYTPDASEEQAANLRPLFSNRTERSEPLQLVLRLPGAEYPIEYQVQTEEQLTGPLEERKVRNEVAPSVDLVQGRYVTLSIPGVSIPLRYPPEALNDPSTFLRYFDYHNLILKAAAYNL